MAPTAFAGSLAPPTRPAHACPAKFQRSRDVHRCFGAAPLPDWLKKAWCVAKRRGLDQLTSAEIDTEIDAQRSKPGPLAPSEAK